jgi:Mg2+/Co2+ transporter CorB
VCLKIGPYRLEILQTEDNRVTRVMMWQKSMVRPVN